MNGLSSAAALRARYAAVIEEHRQVLDALDDAQLGALASAVLGASRVFFSGQAVSYTHLTLPTKA